LIIVSSGIRKDGRLELFYEYVGVDMLIVSLIMISWLHPKEGGEKEGAK